MGEQVTIFDKEELKTNKKEEKDCCLNNAQAQKNRQRKIDNKVSVTHNRELSITTCRYLPYQLQTAAEGTPYHRRDTTSMELMNNMLKTEWLEVSATDYDCRNVKQLGSPITISVGITWLLQQAAIASWRLHAQWLLKDHASIDRSLYKAFFLPTLLCNCCTLGATKSCMDRLDAFHRGLPPAPHPHFRIVKFHEPAPEMTSDHVGYVRTMQIRTVKLRAMFSARKSSGAVCFRTRGTPHIRSACGERSAHLISATRTQLNDGSLPKLFNRQPVR